MRFKSKTFLTVGAWLVLGVVVAVWFAHTRARANPALLNESGYQLYCVKDPFSVAVDKKFPENHSFLLYTEKNPTVFSFDQGKDGGDRANVSVGKNLVVTVVADAEGRPSQLWMTKIPPNGDVETLLDLDVNGTWDMKLVGGNKRFIYFENAWLAADKFSAINKDPFTGNSNGKTYFFDRASGTWKVQ